MQESRQAMESFSPEKRELLELLLHESGAGQDDLAPASFAQERLWFLDQLETGGGLYNIPAAVRMSAALNVAALEASLSEIVRRHETLRTSFVASEGQPLQRIAPARPLGLP